ncbi:MAG: type 4a pilus biogenesis protein PilO [Thermoanaerobaculia bacterium]
MAIDANSLQGKPWYYGLGLGLLLMALAIGGLYYMPIRGWNAEIERLEKRTDALEKDILAGRSAQQRLPQLRDEAQQLEAELDKLRRILPSSRNTEELIKKFKSLVDQGDFVLQQLTFPSLADAAPSESADGIPIEEIYAEWPVQVRLEGRYHDLAVLFSRLANFSRIVNVEQFRITALGQQLERTIQAEFTAKTFVYREPAGEAAAAGGQPGGN